MSDPEKSSKRPSERLKRSLCLPTWPCISHQVRTARNPDITPTVYVNSLSHAKRMQPPKPTSHRQTAGLARNLMGAIIEHVSTLCRILTFHPLYPPPPPPLFSFRLPSDGPGVPRNIYLPGSCCLTSWWMWIIIPWAQLFYFTLSVFL